jgi:hypothetical protein
MVANSDIAARIAYAYAPRAIKRSAGAVRVLVMLSSLQREGDSSLNHLPS